MPKVAGQRVFVAEQGAGDARLFVHCSLGNHQTLLPLANELSPARNVFFDLPGHGKSGAWLGEDYQTECLTICTDLLDAPAHVVGHSFGGTVALRLAIERPDLVSRLTLIEPVLFAAVTEPKARAAYETMMQPFVAACEAGDLEATARAFMGMWGAGPDWSDMPQAMRDRIVGQIHLVPASAPAIEDDVHGVVARLSSVRCPVDLIAGGDTQPVIAAILDRLEHDISDTRRAVIDGARHMVPITHPKHVARTMRCD